MIQTNQTQANKVFDLFPQYNVTKTTSTNTPIKVSIPEQKPDEVVLSNEENKKKSSKVGKIFFGSTIATTIVGAGIASLLIAKGHHGSGLTKWINKLEKSLQNPNISQKTITYKMKKGARQTLEAMQASSNIAAIKDSWSTSILRKLGLGKFVDATSETFSNIVNKTSLKKYNKVGSKIDSYSGRLASLAEDRLQKMDLTQVVETKNGQKTLAECLEELRTHSSALETDFRSNFGIRSFLQRSRARKDVIKDIPEKVGKKFSLSKDGVFNLKNYETYATEDFGKAGQMGMRRKITDARRTITNNIESISDEMNIAAKAFEARIKPDDKTGISKGFAELQKMLGEFRTCSGKTEVADRASVIEKMLKKINELEDELKASDLYKQEKNELLEYLTTIKRTAESTGAFSKGRLEEIKTTLKILKDNNLISEKEYQKLIKESDKITKKLLEATELESGELFVKQAEIAVGSAPNDVLSLIFPAAVGAYAIGKGDNKDEKISATLTTGIPLIGTMATFVYGTVKMLSGAKNLIFSAVSGVVLSKIGNYCDKLYKKYRETGSVTTVVKEEYDNFWTDVGPHTMNQINATKVAK